MPVAASAHDAGQGAPTVQDVPRIATTGDELRAVLDEFQEVAQPPQTDESSGFPWWLLLVAAVPFLGDGP